MDISLMEEVWDIDDDGANTLMKEYDEAALPLPSIEYEPHLLISRVRKHYMEFIIKLLKVNYMKNNKKARNKFHLPSAIWRCAKNIEMSAAQSCMVIQLYRKNIIPMIKELKRDTSNGKIYEKLHAYLISPPENEVKLQTTIETDKTKKCEYAMNSNNEHKGPRKVSMSPKRFKNDNYKMNNFYPNETYKEYPKVATVLPNVLIRSIQPVLNNTNVVNNTNAINNINAINNTNAVNSLPKKPVEAQNTDAVMMQLEKIFHSDSDGNEDIFTHTLYESVIPAANTEVQNPVEKQNVIIEKQTNIHEYNGDFENQSVQIQALEEKLQSFEQLVSSTNGFVAKNEAQQKLEKKQKRDNCKWLCEEYFLKQRLSELMAEIGDCNMRKLKKIKMKFIDLFGEESEEELMSPLEETPEFVNSCKERIAPWVVDLLTEHYMEGRIRDKELFKKVEKYLVSLIYKCSHYPNEGDVRSFVSDFLETHRMIKSEADYRKFRINTYSTRQRGNAVEV